MRGMKLRAPARSAVEDDRNDEAASLETGMRYASRWKQLSKVRLMTFLTS